ncbi:MAG: hypothetical protein MR456_07340 [Spirochaetia bacterium]|nr:hypothetical protein [Spirochaetia bacterium]
MKKRVLSFLVSMLTLALIGGGITGCNNDPDNTPSNPFAGKTFYGTVNDSSYDVCKLDFTSDSKVTLTLYGKGEAGADVVEYLTYTVSDGIATVDYKGQKITTTKIENDTFKASLDGTEANTASFTTKANPAPAKPETPVKPTDPEKPTEPTDPEKPAEPTDPETPVEPTDPETPVEPTDPEKPVEPTDPETPVEPTDPETPVENPFAGKTFYGTGYGSSYDICKLDFTSDLKATLTYYGLGEAGDDLVFNSTYTVSDGIATLDYQGDKVTTTKIENDTFKVSKDGTEEHAISFTTKANPAPAKPETPVKPTDPETPAENPFAGKTFYGTVDGYPYDVCKLDFISDSEVTLTLYGEGEAGADVVLDLTYTVSDGIATVDYEGQKLTTTKIENDTFKASLDGTEENTASFTTNANPAPAAPETPVEPVLKTAAGYNCTKGQGTLEWVDGVAVLQFELPADYGNNWIYPDNPNNSFSFYLETVAGSWKDDCYKAAQTVEIGGEEVDLEIGTAGNNTVTSAESLAGKTLKLTFTGTETAIKCKAEIVE